MPQLLLGDKLQKAAARFPLLLYPLWTLEAAILGGFWSISWCLPPDWASALGYRLFHGIGPYLPKNRHVRANLALAFPEKSSAEIDALARRIWGNFGAVLAEYPHLAALADNRDGQRVEVVAKTDLQPYCEARKSAVFAAAHLGNWEFCPIAGSRLGLPVTVIYSPQKNPLLDRMLLRKRQALGCNFLTKNDSMRATVKLLTSGQSIGLLVDQRVDSGDPIPFFGIAAATTSSPARLALKFGCDLIPSQVERLQGAHFRVTFHPPVEPDDDGADTRTQVLQMTRKLNAIFEDWIRQNPEQWFCSKRRWPEGARPPDATQPADND